MERRKVFREVNESMSGLDRDEPLEFFCECDEPDCTIRIAITPAEYHLAHLYPGCFVVGRPHVFRPGTIIVGGGDYAVVRESMWADARG